MFYTMVSDKRSLLEGKEGPCSLLAMILSAVCEFLGDSKVDTVNERMVRLWRRQSELVRALQ